MRRYFIIILLLFVPWLSRLEANSVLNGEISLNENFYNDEEDLVLDGKWRFYWKELINPEGKADMESRPVYVDILKPWSDLPTEKDNYHAKGYATYELNIYSSRASDKLAIRVPEFYSSYALYLNGEEISQNGKVADNIADAEPYWLPKVVAIKLKKGSNRLVLQVSNFHHHKGGSVAAMAIGPSSRFFFFKNMAVAGSLFIAGTLLIAAVFSLIVYYFQKNDFAFLFFGLFALSYIYRIIGTDTYISHEVFQGLSWHVAIRLEYLSLYVSVIFFTYFYKNLIARRAPEWIFHTIGIVSGLLAISVLLPPQNFTAFVDYYLIFIALALVATTVFYLRAIRWSHTMSWFTSIAVGSLILVMVLKMSAFFGFGVNHLFFSFFLYLVFVVSQTIALSQRFGYNMRMHISQSETAMVSQRNFMNSVSHELRTPMNAIMGMTDFLSKTKLEPDQQAKLETIRKNSEQLNNLLMDLLNFSAIDSGELKLESRKFNLKEVVDRALEQAGTDNLSSTVNFKLSYDDNIPDELAGDPERLGQVIYHIVGNAVKFTQKGIIGFDLRMESVEANRVKLHMKVTDTGIGIKPEELNKVVQAFNQGDEGNTRKHGGTGLGLTIAANIIEMMDGEMWIDSEEGKGTTVRADFVLKTPRLNLTKHAEELKEEQKTKKIEGLKILYAEDNPINQKLLVMIMKTLGYEVELANNGLEAWEMAITNNYHIIFMDVQMPKMDGIEATRRIIKDQAQRPIIIAVTANAEVADQKRCIEAGMNDFIPKPFNAKMLKEALSKWQGLLVYMEEDARNGKLRVIS
ncbi:response regulator [Croceimicrobium hydrocarbonivorans]|uniref:histidine kinase n=1 Tax=Croceimicrobium hydrocarbonivorans TaxID=2761580 RepID=A0A7H0VA62_9FLAO|nr:response regulator [Croceimicrobium hydrocarbonivorans]QNR22610.1 response regulator [Croceimicrobium hydrocarbonivorans]